jgi:hypothetical protein
MWTLNGIEFLIVGFLGIVSQMSVKRGNGQFLGRPAPPPGVPGPVEDCTVKSTSHCIHTPVQYDR